MTDNGARRELWDVIGASVASFLATAADGAVFVMLTFWVVGTSAGEVGAAAAAGAVVGGIVHYSLSRFWVFHRFGAPIVRSAVVYFAMSWAAAVIHGLMTGWLTGQFGPGVAWFVSKGGVWVAWTYPMSRYVVFGGIGAPAPDTEPEDRVDDES